MYFSYIANEKYREVYIVDLNGGTQVYSKNGDVFIVHNWYQSNMKFFVEVCKRITKEQATLFILTKGQYNVDR